MEEGIYSTLNKGLYKETPVQNDSAYEIAPEDIGSGVSLNEQEGAVGNYRNGKTKYTNDESGYILGVDKGVAKFFIGNSTSYLNWTGEDLILNGYSLNTIVEGATTDTNFGLFRGSYNDGLTETVVNATITRNLLTTNAIFSTGSTGWKLASGIFGRKSDSSFLTWQDDYEFFVRLKSDAGSAWAGTTEGRAYFWGLMENGFSTLTQSPSQKADGLILDESFVGFYVAGDDNLYAISGTGQTTTGATGLASMDVTDLSTYDHTVEHNYRIVTHYGTFPTITGTSYMRPTAHSGGNSSQSSMYDSDTNTAGFAERSGTDAIGLSFDGGTTYTAAIVNTINVSKTVVVIGGQYETWGRTWSPSEFSDANFRVKLGNLDASYWGGNFTNSITFSAFGFDTSTWVHVTGIEIELTSETEDEGDGGTAEHKIYDIRVKVYYTTAAYDGYVKFYIDDVLVATHKASVPRGTENPILLLAGGPNGANVASGRQIIYNNYRVKAL